jgi:hypothetical protein
MRLLGWLTGLLVWALAPASARAASLVVDRLDTPDVVQAGDRVSFSFALQFNPDEILLATQAAISAPGLSEFQFTKARGPWDLSADFRLRGDQPMWVYAENTYGEEDAPGVTWDEVGGLAPLGRFSAVATYNGEIEFLLDSWHLILLGNQSIPLAPEWAHIHTGVTVVGGLELPPPAPPPVAPPPTPPPPVAAPPPVAVPSDEPAPSSHPPTPGGPDRPGVMPTAFSCTARACLRTGGSIAISFGFYMTQGELIGPQDSALGAAVPEPATALLMLLGAVVLELRRARKA